MDSEELLNGTYRVSIDKSEVVTLYELISRGERAEDLDTLETVSRAEVVALSRLQMALLPLVVKASTEAYGTTLKAAWEQLEGS